MGNRFVDLIKQLLLVTYMRSAKNLKQVLEWSMKTVLPIGLVQQFMDQYANDPLPSPTKLSRSFMTLD